MGWFWADGNPKTSISVAPHPLPKDGAAPPPGCPMHTPKGKASTLPPRQDSPSTTPSSCPVKSPSQSSQYPTSTKASIDPPQQPASSQPWSAKLNPLNFMPTFANRRSQDSPQGVSLGLERELSSIPRGDSEANWEYPSPQQMYNAMLRKGYTDTPAEDVTSMVAVHNFLNEGAWNEIVEWESIFAKGLSTGWDKCKHGEQGIAMERAKQEFLKARREAMGLPERVSDSETQPKLLRFQGRPNEPTPKARILQYMSWAFPEKFGTEPPFDRHDWYVARTQPDGSTKEVRYVIDYYGGGLQATGEPVFYLDIRPALDTPTAAVERAMRWGGDVWWRASGASAREQKVEGK